MSDTTPANDESSSDGVALDTTMQVASTAQAHRRVWMAGLWPAFRDSRTGETHLAMTADGQRALQHSFHGLPEHWVVQRDAQGIPLILHRAIHAGYWRSPEFFALDAALTLPLDS